MNTIRNINFFKSNNNQRTYHRLFLIVLLNVIGGNCFVFAQDIQQKNSSTTGEITVKLEIPVHVLHPGDYPAIRSEYLNGSTEKGIALNQINETIWGGTVKTLPRVNTFEYEYIIVRANNQVETEWGNNREANVNNAVLDDYLRGFGLVTTTDINVEIRVDLSDLHSPDFFIQQVGLLGGHGRGKFGVLNWNFPEELLILNPVNDNGIWQTTLQIPAGAPIDLPLKFAWQKDDVWDYEFLPYYQIHLLLLDPAASRHSVVFKFSYENYQLQASEIAGLEVDNYRKAVSLYRGSRNYHYHLAQHLLKQGNIMEADKAYALFQKYYPEQANGSYKNYYFTDKVQYMGTHGFERMALDIVEEAFSQEPDNLQKAYYRYLRGWVLQANNHLDAAIQALLESIALADDEEAYHSQKQYSRFGLAMAYMQYAQPEKQILARQYMLEFANTHHNPHLRRLGWEQMAHLTRVDSLKALHEQALQELQTIGSPRQRIHSRVKWVEYLLDGAESDSIITAHITELEKEVTDALLLDEVRLLKARQLLGQNQPEQAREILQGIQARQRNKPGAVSERARHLLQTEAQARGGEGGH